MARLTTARDRRRIGRRLRELRLAAGLTQSDVASGSTSKGFVSLVETGRSSLTVNTARLFARRLNVPLGMILETLITEETVAGIEKQIRAADEAIEFWSERRDRLRRKIAELNS